MGFHNIELPEYLLQYGTALGPQFRTEIPDTDTGGGKRFPRWPNAKRRYEIDTGQLTRAQAADLLAFVHCRGGSAHSFLIKDPSDYTTATDGRSAPSYQDALLGQIDAQQLYVQLRKKYADPIFGESRTIRHAVAGSVKLQRDGVTNLTEGLDFVVDHFLGQIVFPAAHTTGYLSAGCEFRIKARFGPDADDLLSVDVQAHDLGATTIDIIEDQVPEADDGANPSDTDRVFVRDERMTLGGGYSATTQGNPSPNNGWRLDWVHGRTFVADTPSPQRLYLPRIYDEFAAGGIQPGGPHFIVHNQNTSNILEAWEYTSATTESKIQTRPTIYPQGVRMFFVDSLGRWRGV